MNRIILLVVTCLATVLGVVLPAQAERRVALIIGNSQYQSVPKLANPANDAEAMAASLKALGFDQVTVRLDLGYDQFISTLRDFAREADKADWALVYYSGHGIEVGGVNYMIPVDAKLKTDRDVELEAVDINKVLTAVERASKLRIVILDACRDNPFASQIKRTVATRSIGHGLSRIEPGAGTLVVYAAKHGETALDGDGKNSPFAASLLARIDTPNLEVRRLFDVVRDDVMERTRGQQQPFAYGSLSGREDYYFRTAAAAASTPSSTTTTPPPVAPAPQPRSGGAAKDCTHCPEMVSIPKGTFTMGASPAEETREKLPKDEQGHSSPQRAVTLARPFSLGRTEVTRGQYAVFATATGRPMGSSCWSLGIKEGEAGEKEGRNWHNPGFAQTDDAPVLCVSWEDAKAYVDWLTRTTGKPYRLPTEAEWEYAARARTTTARYWGDERHVACRYANVADRSLVQLGGYDNSPDQFFQCSDGYSNTAPVGRFQANAFGLYDMIGNVAEWVEDCWNDDHEGAPSSQDARYSGDCTHRVIRGGSWYSTPATARAAFRAAELYQNHADDLGFRVARSD